MPSANYFCLAPRKKWRWHQTDHQTDVDSTVEGVAALGAGCTAEGGSGARAVGSVLAVVGGGVGVDAVEAVGAGTVGGTAVGGAEDAVVGSVGAAVSAAVGGAVVAFEYWNLVRNSFHSTLFALIA